MNYFYGNIGLFDQKELAILDSDQTCQLIESFKGIQFCGLDLETTGLDFTSDRMLLLSLSSEKDSLVIDWRTITKDVYEAVKSLLEMEDITFLGANIKFDYKFLRRAGIRLKTVYDVILTEQILNTGTLIKNSLEAIAERRLSIKLNKQERTKFSGAHLKLRSDNQPFQLSSIVYASEDTRYLHSIRKLQLQDINLNKLYNVMMLENGVTLAFAEMEYAGMKLNTEKWRALAIENGKVRARLEYELDDIITKDPQLKKFVPAYIQGDLFSEQRRIPINWNSPKQVLPIIQELIPGATSTEADELENFSKKHPFIDTYIRFKQSVKMVTTYGEDFFKYILSDGFIHTDIQQIKDTGRTSSKNPNLQNIPAPDGFRNCFEPNFSDRVFVSADYVSQELVLIAHASKDPVWTRALEHGYDLHSVCAELVYKAKWKNAADENCAYYKEVEDEGVLTIQRQKCKCKKHSKLRSDIKSINFGLAYGMSEYKLSNDMDISVDEARDLIEEYFTTFPLIRDYLQKSGRHGVYSGQIRTLPPFNRKRSFPGWYRGIWKNSEMKKLVGEIERRSKNTPIQGSGADITKFALYHVYKRIFEKNYPVQMVNMVHDQIDTVCPIDFAEQWSKELQEIMEKAALVVVPTGLLKASVEISNVWKK